MTIELRIEGYEGGGMGRPGGKDSPDEGTSHCKVLEVGRDLTCPGGTQRQKGCVGVSKGRREETGPRGRLERA